MAGKTNLAQPPPEDDGPGLRAISEPTPAERLEAWMKATGATRSDAAKRIGNLSPSVISEFLNGKYKGDNEKVARMVTAFLNAEAARAALPDLSQFVSHSISMNILAVLKLTHDWREMGMVYGDAGVGKTYTCAHYCARHPNALAITADVVLSTPKAILQTLAKGLGLPYSGTALEIRENIVATLSLSNRVVIIDEAQHLNVRALEQLRAIHDRSGAAMVLVGNSWVADRMLGARAPAMAQLRSRMAFSLLVTNAKFTDDDLLPFVEQANGDQDVFKLFGGVARSAVGLRQAIKILSIAVAETKGGELTARDWQRALRMGRSF